MTRTDHDLPFDTETDLFDVMAKAMLLRLGRSVIIPFDEMERAADTACTIVKTEHGLVFSTKEKMTQ